VARTSSISVTPNISPTSTTTSGEGSEAPNNLAEAIQVEAEIPRSTRTPSGGLIQGKPVGRSPIGIEAGQSAGGGLNVTVAVPIGGPISGRGGLNIGKDGAIKGAQVGLGVGAGPIGASIDVGTDQDDQGRGGCYQYVTVSAGPFSHTYGRNVCEPKVPTPITPDPAPLAPPYNPNNPTTAPIFPPRPQFPAGTKAFCKVVCDFNSFYWLHRGDDGKYQFGDNNEDSSIVLGGYDKNGILTGSVTYYSRRHHWNNTEANPGPYNTFSEQRRTIVIPVDPQPNRINRSFILGLEVRSIGGDAVELKGNEQRIYDYIVNRYTTRESNLRKPQSGVWDFFKDRAFGSYKVNLNLCAPPKEPQKITFFPIPNPPIRKKMDNECCEKSLMLQAEILRLLGREIGPEGLVPQATKKGFLGEELERIETPITNPIKPKKIKIRFNTVYEMLVYALKQDIDLDVALDPKSYKVPSGYLQNPKYNRDSEESLKSNRQPDTDKMGNKRELEINKDEEVIISSFLQQQSYAFQVLRRLEYLFPFGELEDALIAKNLLIPGGEGNIKIHNMIQAYETLMQYFNATLGNPREILTVKDANPAIKGDQPIEVHALSVSDLLRQNIKFHIDTGGDVDALINLVLRDFRTNLANRIDLIKAVEMIQAVFEDSGMREQQDYIPLHLEGDPYAGQWVKGKGFEPNPDLEKKTEEATEKVLQETMKPIELKVKVSRRHKEEKTDMRDLLRGLADFFQRLLSVPSGGDIGQTINQLVENAKFKLQTERALRRQDVSQAATASRNRTKKKGK
jgi:hypothetical protein